MDAPAPASRRVAVPVALATLPAPRNTGRVCALGGETMGTRWSARFVIADGLPPPGLQQEIEGLFARIIAQMSPWEPESDISRYNRASAGTWHEIRDDFRIVLDHALALAEDTAGAFDPGLGAMVDLWGFGPSPREGTPDAKALQAARGGGAWREIVIDHDAGRVLQPGGVTLDLCGIAKGYAVDGAAECIARHGIGGFLVEIGGELRGFGTKPGGQPWWVALENPPSLPEDAPDEVIVALHGLAVATSGDYHRWFEAAGRHYAHTLDPVTNRPLAAPPASVTVFHETCIAADALATALGVLGLDIGMAYAREHNLAVRFLVRGETGFTERLSPAFAAMLAD